jgi:probable phosphoglycerate mutase
MKSMKVYVVRHGLTEMNQRGVVNGEVDEPLVAEGVQQAKDAIRLIPESVSHIYSSPLMRAARTADIFSTALSVPVITSPELMEIKMGSLAGKSWDDKPSGATLKQLHRTVRFDYNKFGGESLEEVPSRLKELFRALEAKYEDGEVLLVTHGGIIRTLQFLETKEAAYETEKNVTVLTFDTAKMLS